MTDTKKEALPIMVETGYMMSVLAADTVKNSLRVIEHIHEAVSQLNAMGEKIQAIDTAKPLELLYGLISAAYGMKHGHKIISDMLEAAGYEKITPDNKYWSGATGR
tara:strand:+ start:55 stop:372 length:318 start_codon:yes stop_codon:yes gene_type:complete